MPTHQDTRFQLNGVTSNFCMKVVGTKTHAALGLIRLRPTTKRDGPPACGNGFDTSYLAFAKGHVIALELGGSDDPYNVVPQFEHWQGKPNGAWRMMELALKDYAGHVMLVEIGYGRTGGVQQHQMMRDAFELNRLMDWTDDRIPDSFSVYVWPGTGVDPSALTDDMKFDTAVRKLKTRTPTYEVTFNLGNAMPEPDRGMYIVQEAITIAMDLSDKYETPPTGSSYDWEPPMTPMSFLMEEDTLPEIRTQLSGVLGVTSTEAAGFQLAPMILAMHSTTVPKLKKKRKLRETQGHRMVSEKTLLGGIVKKKK